MGLNQLKEFIIKWDNKFPLDYWFRKKYSIPFNSEKHRELSFIDIKIEYEEDKLIKQLTEKQPIEAEEHEYYRKTGQYVKKNSTKYAQLTEDEEQEFFDSIDLHELNKMNQAKK
jgi:hypothetical protein